MISSELLRGHLDAILLRLIRERDCYGYELFSEIEKRSDGKLTIKEATLYAALQRLEKQGRVSSYQGEVSGGSKRRYYHITPTGRLLLEELANTWMEMRDVINIFLER